MCADFEARLLKTILASSHLSLWTPQFRIYEIMNPGGLLGPPQGLYLHRSTQPTRCSI
jgi:hypothetical protein